MKYAFVAACTCILLVSCSSYYHYSPRLIAVGRAATSTTLHAGFGKQAPTSSSPTFDRCPCGSQKGYNECCSTTHILMEANDPEVLIQARYSAYASQNLDFVIQTTSPKSSDYQAFMETALAPDPKKALSRWKRSIKSTMTEGYTYTRFEIDDVKYTDDNHVDVTWRHLAVRHTDNVMFPIEEVSKLEKVEGNKWLYMSGEVRRPKTEVSAEMVEKWPGLVGMELKPKVNEDGKAVAEAPIVM